MNIEIIEKGKSYAARKPKDKRPSGDFYQTPYSFIKILIDTGEINFKKSLGDFSCGAGAIEQALYDNKYPHVIYASDIADGRNYLTSPTIPRVYQTVQNPPFSLWDKFILRAKEITERKIIYLGKVSFFASHKRTKVNLWKNLKAIYVFDRQANLDNPLRDDGKFYAGMACYAWFVWDLKYKKTPQIISVDCDNYVFKKRIKK